MKVLFGREERMGLAMRSKRRASCLQGPRNRGENLSSGFGIVTSALLLFLFGVFGCGTQFGTRPGPLFSVPLEVNGQDAGEAVIDTGGGYELMLKDRFGLEVVGEVDVLLFGGRERAALTESFPYVVGGYPAEANGAFVGLSVCDCNGVGIQFFRKSKVVIAMDFASHAAAFVATVPPGGVVLPFEARSENSGSFDTAFMTVDVSSGDETISLMALLDTGTNSTLLRRGLIGEPSPIDADRGQVFVAHPQLGMLSINTRLFDTPGLPDLILGTDAMLAWGDRWYFTYSEIGGNVTFFADSSTIGDATAANYLSTR